MLSLDPALASDAVEARLAEWSATGPIQGVYWLPALDEEGPLAALEPGEAAEALRVRVKLLAVTMRALTGGGFLVSGTRLGGRHGYDAPGATSALGGAVTGFTKALARERPGALVKAVDFASGGSRGRRSPTSSSRRRCATPARSRSATPTSCAGRSD